jgi:hypothetical protein
MTSEDTRTPPAPLEEKAAAGEVDGATTTQVPRGWTAWFGGPNVVVGPRIGPVITGQSSDSDTDDSSSAILGKQLALEEGCAIQYRTCSWQKVRILYSTFLTSTHLAQNAAPNLPFALDCGSAILRVYLPGKKP